MRPKVRVSQDFAIASHPHPTPPWERREKRAERGAVVVPIFHLTYRRSIVPVDVFNVAPNSGESSHCL